MFESVTIDQCNRESSVMGTQSKSKLGLKGSGWQVGCRTHSQQMRFGKEALKSL